MHTLVFKDGAPNQKAQDWLDQANLIMAQAQDTTQDDFIELMTTGTGTVIIPDRADASFVEFKAEVMPDRYALTGGEMTASEFLGDAGPEARAFLSIKWFVLSPQLIADCFEGAAKPKPDPADPIHRAIRKT